MQFDTSDRCLGPVVGGRRPLRRDSGSGRGQIDARSLGGWLPWGITDLGRRGYAGKLVDWVATNLQRVLSIVKRPRKSGFKVLQWRWIVERTFGRLNRSRRLSKDFEGLCETSETWVRIAMIQIMVRRLAKAT